MSHSNLIIIRIVGWGDLYSTGSKSHVDDNIIRNYWNSTVYERMDGKLAVKMLSGGVNFRLSLGKESRLFTL